MSVEKDFKTMAVTEIFKNLESTPASYLRAERQLIGLGRASLNPLNVALVSSFTLDFLRPYLTVEAAIRGFSVTPYFAPFNQVEQQILDPASALFASARDVVILAMRLEDVSERLSRRFVSLSRAQIELECDDVEMYIKKILAETRKRTPAVILLFNFTMPARLSSGFADANLEVSQTQVISDLNNRLSKLCRDISNAYIFDASRLASEIGLKNWYDKKLWYLARSPYSASAQIEIGKQLARYFRATQNVPAKCLVIDLDQTLWGGIIGEDGLEGILLGDDHPGVVYKEFQKSLRDLKDRGILLAIASKNNLSDVKDVFEKHPECVLKMSDFAAVQIHWEDKAKSLINIAQELNIGTNALVFFDDSPLERGWIRAQLPEVTVIEAPSNPMEYLQTIEDSGAFDALRISNEDIQRNEMYQKESLRKKIQKESIGVENFLMQLKIEATVGRIGPETLTRAAQLIAKTNQFNLTIQRLSAAEVERIINDGAIGLWIKAEDRFGDYGIVGIAIAVPVTSSEWKIDIFLVSCRALGRNIEHVLLAKLAELVRKKKGDLLTGVYIPSEKNHLSSSFYSNNGFENVGLNTWKLNLREQTVPFPKDVSVTFNE